MTTVKLGKLLVSFETFNLNGINSAAFQRREEFLLSRARAGKDIKITYHLSTGFFFITVILVQRRKPRHHIIIFLLTTPSALGIKRNGALG